MKLKFNAETLSLLLTVGISIPMASHAQDASAAFTLPMAGPCATQGSWTRAALDQTSQVKQAIMNLKDNPSCKGLKTAMETNLVAMEKSLQEVSAVDSQTDQRTHTLMQLPQEISALRAFSRENSGFKPVVMDLLFGKTVQMNALSTTNTNGKFTPVDASLSAMSSLTQRSKAASLTGMQLFNNTMTAFQEAQTGCLDNGGQTGAAIAAGLVKILNSFASSNTGIGNQVALSVQKFTTYLARDKKYVEALRKLNDAEFITSMSCLMEVTTDGFCNALDAQYLLKEVTSSQTVKFETTTDKRTGKVQKRIVGMNENFEKRMAKGPLAGYYILTRQVPIVTDWLQKVQYGITPQLPTEATFQSAVSTNVQEHYNLMKRIQGNFNYARKTMKGMTDLKTKQGLALQILQDAASQMVGNFSTQSQNQNFFIQANNANEIYFGLIGMPIPPAVMGVGEGASTYGNRPSEWLGTYFRSVSAFNDPEKLVDLIEQNMQTIFKSATNAAIAYYNQYFIVDKAQVVADSLLGLNSNVRDSLVNIDQYLANFQLRFAKGDIDDPTLLPLVDSTRKKIGKVLLRYRELRNFGVEVLQLSKTDPEFKNTTHSQVDEKLRKISDELLKEVYDEFEVLNARTGLLSNRISSIVLQDYIMSLKKHEKFDNGFQDIMLASGVTALNSMINMSVSDLSDLEIDLARATNLYKTDIDALENVVTGIYVRQIFDNRIALGNENITEAKRQMLAYDWAYKMAAAQNPGENATFLQRHARAIVSRFWGDITNRDQDYFGISWLDKLSHPFDQIRNSFSGRNGKIVSSPTSVFDTNARMLGYLCTQTLAFSNFSPYWALCYEAHLDSPLMDNPTALNDPQIKDLMLNYLSVPYKDKATEFMTKAAVVQDNSFVDQMKRRTGQLPENNPQLGRIERAKNKEARICAYRDYRRRNKIAVVTASMRNDGDTYDSSFLRSLSAEIKPENTTVQPGQN